MVDASLEALGERLAEQAAHLDAAKFRFLTDLREFDDRGGWTHQGARSCAHWLSWRIGWDTVTARDHIRVAHKLADLPEASDALRRGELSYSKVRAITRVATAATEHLLVEYARLTTGAQLERICRQFRTVMRHGEEGLRDDPERRYVRRRDQADGMVRIEAVLHPDEAELVWTMLTDAAKRRRAPADSAEAPTTAPPTIAQPAAIIEAGAPAPIADAAADSAESRPTGVSMIERLRALDPSEFPAVDTPQPGDRELAEYALRCYVAGAIATPIDRPAPEPAPARASAESPHPRIFGPNGFDRADALVELAQAYLRGDRPERAPVELVVTIPLATLQDRATGPVDAGWLGETAVSGDLARRLSCDAGVIEVIEDEHGKPLSVSRKQRTISGSLKRALRRRDGGCAFPGCTNRIYLEGHHIQHWIQGGETSLDNGALLCTQHHRHVHEYGFTIELDTTGHPQFFDPRGRRIERVPAAPPVRSPTIADSNATLAISPATVACGWDGCHVPYRNIIGHLVRAADRP